MEETFFKRVNYPENKPEKTDYYITDRGSIKFDLAMRSWICPGMNPTWWLKPLPILSRGKMIKQISDEKEISPIDVAAVLDALPPISISRDELIEITMRIPFNIHRIPGGSISSDYFNKEGAEMFADAILKAGLPEKKVEIKKSDFKQYSCPECASTVYHASFHSHDKFCHECGSKIAWIS